MRSKGGLAGVLVLAACIALVSVGGASSAEKRNNPKKASVTAKMKRECTHRTYVFPGTKNRSTYKKVVELRAELIEGATDPTKNVIRVSWDLKIDPATGKREVFCWADVMREDETIVRPVLDRVTKTGGDHSGSAVGKNSLSGFSMRTRAGR